VVNRNKMPRIGVVGIPKAWSTDRLIDAFRHRDADTTLLTLDQIAIDLKSGDALFQGTNLRTMDALVVKKVGRTYRPELLDRLAMLRFLSETGVPVFSDPACIKGVLDRLSCTVTLRAANIPMPPTVITESDELAAEAIERFGKAVLKPLYSTKARGMTVVEAGNGTRDELARYREQGNAIYYIQQLLELPGHDLGLVFLGGEFIGCYARVADGSSWNTTIHSGGRYARYEPDDALIALAHRAQAPFGLDFTCVDIAECKDGPVVFEVSAFGGFRGLWESARVDAAAMFADYVLARLGHGGE